MWHPIIYHGNGASHMWRKIIKIREEVKHNISWKIKIRNCKLVVLPLNQTGRFVLCGGRKIVR